MGKTTKNPQVKPLNQIQGVVLFSGREYPELPRSGRTSSQMLEDRQIKVETFPGKTISEVDGFTNKAIIFER